MSYTVYAWWKRPSPNFGGGAKHQQQFFEEPDWSSADRRAQDLVERYGAHYATFWAEEETPFATHIQTEAEGE